VSVPKSSSGQGLSNLPAKLMHENVLVTVLCGASSSQNEGLWNRRGRSLDVRDIRLDGLFPAIASGLLLVTAKYPINSFTAFSGLHLL
jgi:hypothetical protein